MLPLSHTYIQSIQEPSISTKGCFLWDILGCPCLTSDITTNDNALTLIVYIILEVLKDYFFLRWSLDTFFIIIFQLSGLILLIAWIKTKPNKNWKQIKTKTKKSPHTHTKKGKNNTKWDHLVHVHEHEQIMIWHITSYIH